MKNRIQLLFLLFSSVRVCIVAATCNVCPFQWTPFGTSCYRLYQRGMWYDTAEQHCRDLSTYRKAAHLVSINSQEELDFVARFVETHYGNEWKEIWIGLRLDNTARTTAWEDGSDPAAFSFWKGTTTDPAPYAQGCTLYTISHNTWKAWSCETSVPSVCKMDQD